MTLEEFVDSVTKDIARFGQDYNLNRKESLDPDQEWPLEMPYQEWWDQLDQFVG